MSELHPNFFAFSLVIEVSFTCKKMHGCLVCISANFGKGHSVKVWSVLITPVSPFLPVPSPGAARGPASCHHGLALASPELHLNGVRSSLRIESSLDLFERVY